MPKEISKAYDANLVEKDIYQAWEESGFFNPDNLTDAKDAYCISMPPPNVTGILHLGHALENTLMDIEVRYQRMQGKKALLIPGTDHAAVATQARVEDNLKKQGIANPRQQLGRDGLLEKIREYAEDSKSNILNQIKRMGTSCDWSRLAYTFDETRSETVYTIFKKMYEDKLIYKGYRVVNWSVVGQSTCSDDELVYVDQPAKIYTFKYSADFPIAIASTRPETKLGDTAVAVHPDDERYQKYIGQKFIVDVGTVKPLTIKIIADSNVDPKYGTGAVGVTPAHSQIDFEMYEKNKEIGLIQVIGQDGKMTENAGQIYAGLSAVMAREKFVAWLKENNLLIEEKETEHNVGTSDRFKDVVEALPMEQWFVDVNKKIPSKNKSLKDLMRTAVTSGLNNDVSKKISIQPERFKQTYMQWLDNLRDWNISRQIWWGHRIPIWYRDDEIIVSDVAPDGNGWKQDEDTLDTWFSSGTWTFSTLGWPSETNDYKNYHPTAWMQMGYEILFFWMARMILMSAYALNDIPFRSVYIHGILRDKDGQKFSKSAGNGIDPILMIDKYGCDALRMSLIKGVTPGNDARFYEDKVLASRNFINKLWNVSRYIIMSSDEIKISQLNINTVADHWIISKLQNLIQSTKDNLDKYNFSQAGENLYDFMWRDLADWYLEITKFQPNQEILIYILDNLLRLLHPFIPFVTEEIWQNFDTDKLLMIEAWPVVDGKLIDNETEAEFKNIQDIIIQIRNLRTQYKIAPSKIFAVYTQADIHENIKQIISKLARVEINCAWTDAKNKITEVSNADYKFKIILGELIDIDAEKTRLAKEIFALEKYTSSLEKKLANKNFTANAPAQVIEQELAKLSEKTKILKDLKKSLENL
ncbi:MAG: valine--tRNA ligase [Patescibacteria group bacterium]